MFNLHLLQTNNNMLVVLSVVEFYRETTQSFQLQTKVMFTITSLKA